MTFSHKAGSSPQSEPSASKTEAPSKEERKMNDCKFCDWENPHQDRSLMGQIIRGHNLTNHLLEHLIKEARRTDR
jgi:hypothetical protein